MAGFKLAAAANLLAFFPLVYAQDYGNTFAGANSTFKVQSPHYYPSPKIEGAGDWAAAYTKAKTFVSQLTLLEKVNLTTGTGWQSQHCVGTTGPIPRLGFPSLCLQDSPLGVRYGDYASAFPSGMNAAMTWDRNLMYQRGYAMGSEFKAKGANFGLGPVAGPIGRAPEGARNWEGFSPDPWLTGAGMWETVQGMQDAGVIATAKHFIGNEQDHFRQVTEAIGYGYNITETISSNIDDRTIHELYMWPFADAVRAGVGAIMCSYNQVNNTYSCQNSKMLNGLLKDELNFQGVVMSDWQAQHSGVESAMAGLDMAMPGDFLFNTGTAYWGPNMTLAVVNGTIPEWRLDDMCTRIMATYYKMGQDPATYPKVNFNSWNLDTMGFEHYFAQQGWTQINQHVNVQGDHKKIIREVAAKGTVLLKNVDGVLPLGGEKQVGVFGSDAAEPMYGPNGCSDRGCDNGTLAMGWGSGSANFPYLITPLNAITNRAVQEGSVVQSVTDDYAYAQINSTARLASVCLTFVNTDSGEGYISIDGNEGERKNLTLWHGGDQLIKTVAASCNNTVVIIHGPGPVVVEEWIDHVNVTAVLFAGFPGQESGNSLIDVLYGDVNPSGKLVQTWAKNRYDYGTTVLYKPNGIIPQQNFAEGLYIDYRYLDKEGIEPRFEFGYGLSYTTFNYSNLYIAKIGNATYTPATGMRAATPVSNVTSYNIDDMIIPPEIMENYPSTYIYPYLNSTSQFNSNLTAGSGRAPDAAYETAAQPIPAAGGAIGGNPSLYQDIYEVSCTVTNTGTVAGEEIVQLYIATGLEDDPVVVLRGFEKYSLAPGQLTTFRARLNVRDLARWDVTKQDWVIVPGTKEVRVGSSSRNTPLVGKIELS